MRQNCKFRGTEEEFEVAMRNNLKSYNEDLTSFNRMSKTLTEEDFTDICETMAECIDRGYISYAKYTWTLSGKLFITISPLKEEYETLTEAGKRFLNL